MYGMIITMMCNMIYFPRLEDVGNNYGALVSSAHAVQGSSYFFDGISYIILPISADPLMFPQITIGAWIKPTKQNTGAIDER